VTDFVSRRDRRVTEPEKNTNQLDIEFETGRAAARWIRAMERFDPVELFSLFAHFSGRFVRCANGVPLHGRLRSTISQRGFGSSESGTDWL
jgi:hypothetical protein